MSESEYYATEFADADLDALADGGILSGRVGLLKDANSGGDQGNEAGGRSPTVHRCV